MKLNKMKTIEVIKSNREKIFKMVQNGVLCTTVVGYAPMTVSTAEKP